MKKLLVILMVGLMASAAVAQDTGTNSFGLYLDAGFTQNEIFGVAPGMTVPVYMVVANPTVRAARGLEIEFAVSNPATMFYNLQSIAWNLSTVDIDDRPLGIIAGMPDPGIPAEGGFIHFGTMNFQIFSNVGLLAGPNQTASIAGEAILVDADNLGNKVPLEFATDPDGMGRNAAGWLTLGYELVGINVDAGVNAQESTWSGVKGMFR